VVARWKQSPGSPPAREWLKTLTPVTEPKSFLAIDSKGTRIVTLNLQGEDHDYKLGAYDPRDWSSVSRTPVSDKIAYWDQLLFHPQDTWLALRSRNAIYLWNANDFAIEPKRIAAGKKELTSLAFHPSGRFLAATSNDETVKLYDTETWQIAQTFSWKIGRLRSIAFSPDGNLAAAGSDTGKIVVWDVDL
jgi:WD40 repeat protein